MRVDRKHPRPGTLAQRAAATSRVVDRFSRRPFDWKRANCWKLTAAQARAMGHAFPPVPQFRSALGAKKALAADGFASAEQFLDARFERLPSPAFARVGDLVLFPGDPDGNSAGLDAVFVAGSDGNVFGWHGASADGLPTWVKFALADAIGAWRL